MRRQAKPLKRSITQEWIQLNKGNDLPFFYLFDELKGTVAERDWWRLYLDGEGKELRFRPYPLDSSESYSLDEVYWLSFVLYMYRNRAEYPAEWQMVYQGLRPYLIALVDALQ